MRKSDGKLYLKYFLEFKLILNRYIECFRMQNVNVNSFVSRNWKFVFEHISCIALVEIMGLLTNVH